MSRPCSPEIILIFRGTHQVLSAEKVLKRGGVAVRLIPVPRRLASDCGLAIRIPPADRDKAREALRRASIAPVSVHVSCGEEQYLQETL